MIDSGSNTPETLARRRLLGEQLMMGATKPRQIEHWTQGAAQMAEALMGGLIARKAGEEDKALRGNANEMIAAWIGGQPQAATPAPNFGDAIASIESGGKYDALGPVTKTGDRAYGKYQVMGANVGPWTKAYAGAEMTPDQFIASPQAQDAVFKGEFGRLAGKHGPEGAARAWFAGEGGMNDMNRKDQLGTSVAQYGQKFAQALGPQTDAPQSGMNREALVKMLNNPYTAPMAQGIVSNMIGQQFKPETTDEIKEYNLYSKQEKAAGRAPLPFYEYKTGLKRAGAIQNSVQIDQKGESSFSTEAGKLQAKRFNDLAEDAPAAKQMLSDVEMLRDLGTKIQTGKGAEAKAVIGPFAEALGVKIDGLSEIQAFDAIVNRVAPNLRVKGSGAQSDFELRNFLKSIPSLGNTPEGNEIAGRVLEGLSQNKIAAAEIGAKALNGEMTRAQAEKAIRDLPDPMKEWREFNKAAKKGAAQSPAGGGSLGGTTKNGMPWKVVQ